jgi:hypothetical protein
MTGSSPAITTTATGWMAFSAGAFNGNFSPEIIHTDTYREIAKWLEQG